MKPCVTLDAHFTTPDKKDIQDALLMNGEKGWRFYENYNVLMPDMIYQKLSYLPNHNEKLHELMIDNVNCFCESVCYTKQKKQLYLPFRYNSIEESYNDFVANVDLSVVNKINLQRNV